MRTDHVTARTSGGLVRGRRVRGVLQFRGVPYGASVSGARRFSPPAPVEPWAGVRDALLPGPRAIQEFGNLFQTALGDYFSGGRIGDLDLNHQRDAEDCLVLDVVTPSVEGLRPTMVYIHGGGFAHGSGILASTATQFAAEEDVVVIGVNHRLGVFGFLDLSTFDPAYAASGNVGILDLVAALEWVRDNILEFGGDPRNVTIFGESGGGAKICTVLAMPQATNLYARAIIQSGPLLRARSGEQAREDTAKVLAAAKVSADDPSALHRIDPVTLNGAAHAAGVEFGPVLDGAVLPRHPFEPDAPPWLDAVPMIIGHCRDEATWFEQDAIDLADIDAGGRFAASAGPDADATEAAYRAAWPSATRSERYLSFRGDAMFGIPSVTLAEVKARQRAHVFAYRFEWSTPVEGGVYGAFHTAELPLVLRRVRYPESEGLSRTIAAAWASFARTGDPSTAELAWPSFEEEQRQTMMFELHDSHMEQDPQAAARQFWKSHPRLHRLGPWEF